MLFTKSFLPLHSILIYYKHTIMKQRLISLFLALFCIAAGAQADVVINDQNFPDEIFRNWLLLVDNDKDEKFSDEEIANITGMRIDGMGIETLQGIEYFTALKELFCSENQLKTLDLSKNTALEGLFCYDNQLTTLDVSNCTALESLYCVNNQLESLDVSNNTALAWLDCGNNQLTSLVVSNNTALQSLSCSNNQLTSLVVSNNTALTSLNFSGNQLTSLDVSKNTALTSLSCGRNQLTSINLSTNTALTTLECGMNQLTSLDLSKNMALTSLECGMNQLTSLDLSKNTALRNLRCYKNAICGEGMTTLVNSLPTIPAGEEGYMVVYFEESFAENTDPDGNKMTPTQLKVAKDKGWKVYMMSDYQEVEYICGASEDDGVAIDATNFPDENFRNWLSKQNYGRDGILTDAEIAGVEEIEVYNKNIADLTGIQYFTELKTLICNDNQLTTLDVSKNTALTSLYCAWNKINTLNVSKNTNLSTLDCGWNQLTTLNVSKNTALEYLYCHLNQLTALDVSKNTALSDLNCSINQLTALDVSKNMNLRSLAFYDNDISGESMTTLVNSLPTIPAGDNGDLFVYNESEGTSDRNRITSAQVKVATDKGWKVYNSEMVEYAGEPEANGDINGDGHENIADVVMLSKAILAGSTDTKYDVNGDGQVNADDITALVESFLYK